MAAIRPVVIRDPMVAIRYLRIGMVSALFSLACYALFDLGGLGDGASVHQHIVQRLCEPLGALYVSAPALLLPELVHGLLAIARSRPMTFDPRLRTVKQGDRHLAAFSDIQGLRVEIIGEKKPRYVLWALLPGERRLEVQTSERRERIDAVAEKIAAVLDIEMVPEREIWPAPRPVRTARRA